MERATVRALSIWVFGMLCLTTQSGCETNGGDDLSEPVEDFADASDSRASADDSKSAPLALGKLYDEEVRQVIHDGLKARIEVGTDQQGVEIGDEVTFKYSVLKLTKGKDDVSGGKGDDADGLEVEVTGWFKQHVEGGSGPSCISFDTTVPVVKLAGKWQLPKDYAAVSYSRQDQEDCF
jgi:hypothetical protein